MNEFIITPQFKDLIERSLLYIQAGFAIHFSGPAGTGKTALALHIAQLLGRPYVILHGNDEYQPSDLVGGNYGIKRKRVLDNYIHNVWKAEENVDNIWYDGRLAEACRFGHTLVYDEFTRSRPETNNVLLSVLQEGVLDLSTYQNNETTLKVHPDFALILTSNPEEYAGVHPFQDALRDRIITLEFSPIDSEAEIAIVAGRSGLTRRDATRIVNITRGLRGTEIPKLSMRASIITAKILATKGANSIADTLFLAKVFMDVLGPEISHQNNLNREELYERIQAEVKKFTL